MAAWNGIIRHGRRRSWGHLLARLPGALLRRSDALLWRPADPATVHIDRLVDRQERPFIHFDTDLDDPVVAARMRGCNAWEQQEYVHRVRGTLLIDPHTGFVVLPGLRFLRGSLPYDYQAGRPSTWRILATRWGLRKGLSFPRIISFRDVNEHNYFHFLNDVLTKVPLFERAGLLDAPVLIGHGLWSKPFFQAVRPALEAAGLQLIDQGDRVVRAREIVYGKSMPLTKAHIDRVLDLIDAPRVAAVPGRKVFLGRSAGHTGQRLLANKDAVEALLRAKGFEVHDPGAMPLREQMELLGGTGVLVVLHGAGAANMVFRRNAPLQVLELFPSESIPPHYHWMARAMGHGYQGLVCGSSGAGGAFTVPLDRLEAALDKALQRASA